MAKLANYIGKKRAEFSRVCHLAALAFAQREVLMGMTPVSEV